MQVTGPSRELVDAATLDRMTDAMTHRGPNDRGTHRAPGIALGARRLSIVDVAGGHQPFFDERRRDRRRPERRALQPRRRPSRARAATVTGSPSRCDTEILPHLYEQHGTAYPERLRGKFAVAIWDAHAADAASSRATGSGSSRSTRRSSGDVVVFASELKSVLASGLVSPELDYDAIDAYLTLGYVPAPRTPLAGGVEASARGTSSSSRAAT